jgi:glycosyltransferase involved in cell wall biosynthesis
VISCVITSFNQKETLKEAIESVIGQGSVVDEILIADDASTDGSQDAIRSFSLDDERIVPIFRGTNLGVSANRDLALRQAKNALVTTLDGDDLFSPGKIDREFQKMQKTRAQIVFSDIEVLREDEGVEELQSLDEFAALSAEERLAWIVERRGAIPRDMLMDREAVVSAGGYKHGLKRYEDWDLKIRLAAGDLRWTYSAGIGTVYRVSRKGLSGVNRFRLLMDGWAVLDENAYLIRNRLGPAARNRARMAAIRRQFTPPYGMVRRLFRRLGVV